MDLSLVHSAFRPALSFLWKKLQWSQEETFLDPPPPTLFCYTEISPCTVADGLSVFSSYGSQRVFSIPWQHFRNYCFYFKISMKFLRNEFFLLFNPLWYHSCCRRWKSHTIPNGCFGLQGSCKSLIALFFWIELTVKCFFASIIGFWKWVMLVGSEETVLQGLPCSLLSPSFILCGVKRIRGRHYFQRKDNLWHFLFCLECYELSSFYLDYFLFKCFS